MTLSPRADIGVPAAHPAKGCGVWECAQSTFSLSPPQGHCCLPPCSASPTLSNKSCCCLSPKSLYKGRIAAALGHPLGRGTPTPSSPSALHCCGSLCLESAGTLGGDLSASCSGAVSSQLPTTSICAAIKKIAGLTGRNKIKRGGGEKPQKITQQEHCVLTTSGTLLTSIALFGSASPEEFGHPGQPARSQSAQSHPSASQWVGMLCWVGSCTSCRDGAWHRAATQGTLHAIPVTPCWQSRAGPQRVNS